MENCKKVYNVLDYGIQLNSTLQTKNVQKLVDDVFAIGGGIIFFPKGEYVLSTIFLKSNIDIFLEEGAVIKGSSNFYDFAPHEQVDYPLYQDASHSFFHTSLFVAENCNNIAIMGSGIIDMQSVWDEDNVRKICHRGAKSISLKNCSNIQISGISILNATDLGVYFAGCENVDIFDIKMRVHIDGISPDNSKNVYIHDCDIETGDDGIVLKSSYSLNKLGECDNIKVENCTVKSRCSALKIGTETNGGFKNISFKNIKVYDTKISGIALESVDGATIDGLIMQNITMQNVGCPLFICISNRMRGPKNLKIGKIENIILDSITAKGPYVPYECITWRYESFKNNDIIQYPWARNIGQREEGIPFDCSISGLKDSLIKNITLKNINFHLRGGKNSFSNNVPSGEEEYPEPWMYGQTLPAKGIYFRNIDGLNMENVNIFTEKEDAREDFVFDNVTFTNNNR